MAILYSAEDLRSPLERGKIALGCVVATCLLAVLAWPMLTWWVWEYTRSDSYYSHGPVVPLLAALMLWGKRDALRAVVKRPAPVSLLVLVPALLLHIVARRGDMQALQSLSFLVILVSSLWFLAGTRFLRVIAAPLAFLWLMAPLPCPLLNDATIGAQSFSTAGATHILSFLGFGPIRTGNVIALDDFTMTVDLPCSGFGLLLRLLTFSAAFALLTDASRSRRALLFLFSLPLSMAINTLRIAGIGVIGECLGSGAAAAFHDSAGIMALILCMVILFGLAKVLRCQTFAGQPIF